MAGAGDEEANKPFKSQVGKEVRLLWTSGQEPEHLVGMGPFLKWVLDVSLSGRIQTSLQTREVPSSRRLSFLAQFSIHCHLPIHKWGKEAIAQP